MNIRKILADDDIKQLQEIFNETPELIYSYKISNQDILCWAFAHKTCKLCIDYLKKHYCIENIRSKDYTYSGWHTIRLNPTLTFAKHLSKLRNFNDVINDYNDKGNTPLATMICSDLYLKPFELDKKKSIALLAFMVEQGADVNKPQEKSGKTSLQLIADKIKYKPLLLSYLNTIILNTQHTINFNHQDNEGNTLFHTMGKMINNVSNESGVNKKMLSFINSFVECNKADISIKNKEGVSAKDILKRHMSNFSAEINEIISNNLQYKLEERAVKTNKIVSTASKRVRL